MSFAGVMVWSNIIINNKSINQLKMKKKLNVKVVSLVLSCLILSLSSCEEDDTKPVNNTTNNQKQHGNFKVGGSISAEVDGEYINYSNTLVDMYGLALEQGRIVGVDSSNMDTTYKLNVIVSLRKSVTGTFDHDNLKGIDIQYHELVNSSNKLYNFKSDKKYQINISKHELIGKRNDTTFYNIAGTFNFEGEIFEYKENYYKAVVIEYGAFEYTAYYWDGDGW